jgi:hypothetical protein
MKRKKAAASRILRLPWAVQSIERKLDGPGKMIVYLLPEELASNKRKVNLLIRYFSTEETCARTARSLFGRYYLCVERISDGARAIG